MLEYAIRLYKNKIRIKNKKTNMERARKVTLHREGAVTARRDRVAVDDMEINSINNAELRMNAQRILSVIHSSRPQNTTSSYSPKQEEFKDFCRRKLYQDNDTVTEDKLLLFLVEEVADRPLRTKSRKAAAETPQTKTRLTWRSVRSYITAITDLYRTQKARGMN